MVFKIKFIVKIHSQYFFIQAVKNIFVINLDRKSRVTFA